MSILLARQLLRQYACTRVCVHRPCPTREVASESHYACLCVLRVVGITGRERVNSPLDTSTRGHEILDGLLTAFAVRGYARKLECERDCRHLSKCYVLMKSH